MAGAGKAIRLNELQTNERPSRLTLYVTKRAQRSRTVPAIDYRARTARLGVTRTVNAKRNAVVPPMHICIA